MTTTYRTRRNASRKPQAPKPEFALCVILKAETGRDGKAYLPDGYPIGYIVPMQVNHPHTEGLIAQGVVRRFDPAKDNRGRAEPYRNLWTRQDGEWFPETEGWWAVRFRDDAIDDVRRRFTFQYGEIHHPRHSIDVARKDLDDIRRRNPELAAQLVVVKLPCVMSNRESHIICG
jgi:hypothetical protein